MNPMARNMIVRYMQPKRGAWCLCTRIEYTSYEGPYTSVGRMVHPIAGKGNLLKILMTQLAKDDRL